MSDYNKIEEAMQTLANELESGHLVFAIKDGDTGTLRVIQGEWIEVNYDIKKKKTGYSWYTDRIKGSFVIDAHEDSVITYTEEER